MFQNYFCHNILHFKAGFKDLPITVLPDFRLAAVWKRMNGGEEGLHCSWGPSAPPALHPGTRGAERGITAVVGLVDLGTAVPACCSCGPQLSISMQHPTVARCCAGMVGQRDRRCGTAAQGSPPWHLWVQQMCSSAQLCVEAISRKKKMEAAPESLFQGLC